LDDAPAACFPQAAGINANVQSDPTKTDGSQLGPNIKNLVGNADPTHADSCLRVRCMCVSQAE
jgi:hypothetical protein